MRRDVLNEFKCKYNLELVTQEAGFGEIVTGFIPKNGHMYISLCDELIKTKPDVAYSHCNILAVVGSGVCAKYELAKWINKINKCNVVISCSINNNIGIQKELSGDKDYVLKII